MTKDTSAHLERDARLRWVPISKMKVSPVAQRDINKARVDYLATNFDLEQLGAPVVSERDGGFYIIDGQHRIEALKEMGWADQQVQCWTYQELTEQEEADKFDRLNDVLAVQAFDRYRTRVTAGREVECDIERIVRALGLVVSRDAIPGAIRAVGTLRRTYTRGGPSVLSRTLRVIRDAYGDPGLEAPVIGGLGLLFQRYNGDISDEDATDKLSKTHGGVNALLGKAENLRRSTGNPKEHCVAAAAIEIINAKRGGKKLPSWWKAAE